MRGLGGNDTYVVDQVNDLVDESLAGSGGYDRVISTVTVNFSNTAKFKGAIERIDLAGTANIDAFRNLLRNVINGNSGDNDIKGRGGHDILTGGAGADNFIFDSALSATNIVTITDFDTNEDTIILGANVFGSLGGGALDATNLRIAGTGAADADDYILYNPNNGVIYYDADATGGSHNWVAFARVDPGTVLDADDFFIMYYGALRQMP